jgi:hypothetical protein
LGIQIWRKIAHAEDQGRPELERDWPQEEEEEDEED